MLVGSQAVIAAVAARLYALAEELGPPSSVMARPARGFTLERGLIGAAVLAIAGAALVLTVVWRWIMADFGALDPMETLHPVVIGATLIAVGAQSFFLAFVFRMFLIPRRRESAEELGV